jgi:hypothetical protein
LENQVRIAGGKTSTFWEWVAIFGGMAVTIAATEALGVAPKWESASVYTVIVFVVVITAMRPAWGRSNFWRALAVAFLLHTLAIFFAMRELVPATSRGIHGIPMILSGMVEALVIASFLWRASKKKSIGGTELV